MARFITALLIIFAAHHALAAPLPGKSAFVNDQTLLVRTQGFQIELGVSNGLIFRSLAKKGYTDIKITKRKLTKARAEACRKGKRYIVEIKFNGDVKPIKKIGSCQSTVDADTARKKLKKKGFRQIQLLPHGNGFVAAACRDKRRFRLSINEYGEVRKKTVLGRCGVAITQYDVAALLRAQGYSRIRVEPARRGNYSVDACRQDDRVKLVVSNFGAIVREKPNGRCDPPIHPAIIPAILARYGFSRIDVIDRTLPRYVAHACRDTQRVAISMNRFGEIVDEESIGRCDPPLSADGLKAMLHRIGYDRVRNVRDTPSGYVAEVCEDGLRLDLELTRYGETISQKSVGECQSRRVRRVIKSLEKEGVRGATLYVDGCVDRNRVRIEIDRFGNPGRQTVIGTCRQILSRRQDVSEAGTGETNVPGNSCFHSNAPVCPTGRSALRSCSDFCSCGVGTAKTLIQSANRTRSMPDWLQKGGRGLPERVHAKDDDPRLFQERRVMCQSLRRCAHWSWTKKRTSRRREDMRAGV